ncbi:hypothetical protein H8N03_09995 [Ramlibacter sp. USB13]|uniref:Uncharacterized protein n=1 Tax=Ramlibacter cellulosilyticus TaxID=2764187 RepID=A0A923MQU6_9BURK|nr:hypothetical protein [Ramlibacter cellulosilyticus]MBC5783276.1 hypothetical protein [Ramlibacter cellulosilyticus]
MGLIGRIFGGKGSEGAAAHSTQFHESEPDSSDQEGSRNAPRRELVQVILRDTMRKHGIPSDWIECRMLSTVNRVGRHGLHVNFVVKQAHDRLLAYVFAFQDSFERELARFEPRARDWLLSIGWEFQGFNAAEMPDPRTWAQSGPAPLMPMPGLRAGALKGFEPTEDPLAADAEPPKSDEDVQRDLEALFAIRDQALADAAGRSTPKGEEFEPTQPFSDSSESPDADDPRGSRK